MYISRVNFAYSSSIIFCALFQRSTFSQGVQPEKRPVSLPKKPFFGLKIFFAAVFSRSAERAAFPRRESRLFFSAFLFCFIV